MTDIWQPTFQDLSKNSISERIYASAIANQFPIAVWRDPNSTTRQTIVDLSGKVEVTTIDFSVLPAGFCFAQFDNEDSKPPFFLKTNLYVRDSFCWFTNGSIGSGSVLKNKRRLERTIRELDENGSLAAPGQNCSFFTSHHPVQNFKIPSQPEYCNLVGKAVQEIRQGSFEKVVLSRLLEVELAETFHPLWLFDNLCKAYQNAFVSLVALPGIGTWIGAFPELLFSLQHDELKTVALAGTQSILPSNNSRAREWSEKELIEQRIVSNFIRDCFEGLGIYNYSEQHTETIRIGNLFHLQTKFSLPGVSQYGEKVAEAFLKSMHPTPAVCGSPMSASLEFIRNHEFHHREFYAGFLGPVNLNNQSQLFVNLRCLQLREKSALLYAGGGITIDSIPEQEWQETELKLEALLNFVKGEIPEPDKSEIPNPKSQKWLSLG